MSKMGTIAAATHFKLIFMFFYKIFISFIEKVFVT